MNNYWSETCPECGAPTTQIDLGNEVTEFCSECEWTYEPDPAVRTRGRRMWQEEDEYAGR